MSFLLASAARATTGARSGQEDAFRLWPAEGVAQPKGEDGGLLAVLADGMGGHTGGAIAGQTACSTFADVFAGNGQPYDERLQSALHASNEALARGVEQNAALRGMGCTLIGAWMDTFGIRWTSVGDSLLLLYRFPDVIRLNADHSLGSYLDEQARQNRISEAEAKQHHNRNALRSALTGAKIDLIDLRSEPLELRAGDWILLASDGICSLEGDEIADVVYNYRQSAPEQMAEGLIAAVVKKGVVGQDNTTVVAVRVDEAPEDDATTTRVVRRGDDEKELRSRRIGITGRKTSPPQRVKRRNTRSVVWLAAAAVFFLFFAATVLLRSMQSTQPTSPEAAIPAKREPAAVAAPEPATPDTPGASTPDPQAPSPPAAAPPAQPPKSAAPDATDPAALPKASPPGPAPQKPVPIPQRATPVRPAPTGPSDSPAPSPTPSGQSGEVQEERSQRANRIKQDAEREQERRARRQERQAREALKDGGKEGPPKSAPKEAFKSVPKELPKEPPKSAPKDPPRDALPWGFGGND